MKAKFRVTAILAICTVFFFAMLFDTFAKNKETVQEASNDVTYTSDTEPEIITLLAEEDMGDSSNASNEVMDEVSENMAISSFMMEEPAEEVTVEPVEPLKIIETAAVESIENTITMTLSLSDPYVDFEQVIPNVNEYLNIRSEADANSDIVGKLYKNSYATIVERGEDWTKITSGSVTGYANNQYLYFDDNALNIAKSLDALKVKITAGTVNIRTKPTTDSEVIKVAKKDEVYAHVPEMDNAEWIAIQYTDSSLAYVSAQFVTTYIDLKTAVSKEEEEAARKAAELAKALEEAKKYKPEKTNRVAITVSDEDLYLLATVVAMEALGESYEGQLAVANVVVNRMLDGYWGTTIPEVVYAKGQFSGANSGRVEKFASKVTESCKRAAVEALAGNNNIGDYMFFIMNNKAKYSSYTKYYILGCHCFYSRK